MHKAQPVALEALIKISLLHAFMVLAVFTVATKTTAVSAA